MKKTTFIPVLLSLLFLLGCAGPNIVSHPGRPGEDYDSLGTLELHMSKKYPLIVRVLTFGLLNRKSYTRLQKDLNNDLYHKAHGQFGADAVADVVYWPQPGSDAKLGDIIYGRGEMIRYKKFAEE